MKYQSNLDKKIHTYLDREFAGIGESQQLYELKEELAINLKEKTKDYEKAGQTEEKAFKEAISTMGDLSGLKEDMRRLGEDKARKEVYTSMSSRISAAGLIVGILVIVFGALTTAMLYFMDLPGEAVTGPAFFIVIGGSLAAYSMLTRETAKYYAMTKGRALLYTLAVGLILFSLFTAVTSGIATGEMFIAISSFMVFFMIGLGLWLVLLFTTRISRKK
ncbi:permease prefix domain 1-containing protein [Halobacillus sp. Marseille-Q1614]|uniref:permease prefix domain 1-containing protein n=1 Tax=Halobacillus sp. Marseille-Q1614 TaxID=2709134 RepID=UPI00156DD66B|nr:permease prefix domain 1-containing protein [Halobacillus sp. Marseille-Q1614]